MKISIIIPCYNEEKACLDAMIKLAEYFRKNNFNNYEVIFVDDGSTDYTRDYIYASEKQFSGKVFSIVYDTNKGKGFAVRQGLKTAKGDYIFYLDADMATDLKFIKDSILAMENGADVVMGSRRLPQSITNESDNFIRSIVSKGCVICSRLIVPGMDFSDTQCGCKAMKREVVKSIMSKLKINGFSFDIEILANCINQGYKIKEIPIIWKNRDKGSKVNVIEDSIKFLRDLILIREMTKK